MGEEIEGLPLQYAKNCETHVFHMHFVNIDISLVMKFTFLKLDTIQVAKIQCEGILTQSFYIDLISGFILCGKVDFQNNYNKIKMFPIFCTKIITST